MLSLLDERMRDSGVDVLLDRVYELLSDPV